MTIVEPVDIIYQFVCFSTKCYWFNVQVCKTFVLWVANEILVFKSHHFRIQPGSEELSVETLPPFVVVIFICVFEFDQVRVRLDLCDFEKHLVNFFVAVGVWTSKVIGLTDTFLHFNCVKNGKGDVLAEHWLDLGIHPIDYPVHSVEHLHLHTPLACYRWIHIKCIVD